jgi:hypothetical protein
MAYFTFREGGVTWREPLLKKVSEGGAAAAQAAAIDRATTSAATINLIVERLLSLLLRAWADVCCFLGEMQRVPTICAAIAASGKTHPWTCISLDDDTSFLLPSFSSPIKNRT